MINFVCMLEHDENKDDHIFNLKTQLTTTLTILYQIRKLIQWIDTEFYCGSRGMFFK